MKKTKLLWISDDIRLLSGVSIQSKKLLEGLNRTGRYDVVEIAGSLIPQPQQPVLFNNIKLYPTSDGYGNPNMLRYVLQQEKPDITVAFSDPRFFIWLFTMDNEVRPLSRFLFYHTWDNAPFPKFNLPWYYACDRIVMLSKFSHALMTGSGLKADCVPHGMDPTEFYPLTPEQRQTERQNILKTSPNPNATFVLFWNNRNISRKRPADIMQIFKQFHVRHPDSVLIMNTSPVDKDGTDLISVYVDTIGSEVPILFNFQQVESNRLNALYNVADVTLNIAFNEGFGLCVAESLCAGTPVIVTQTGGMGEQVKTEEGPAGALLEPVVQEMFGIPGMAYIYRDYVSYAQTLQALENAYEETRKGTWKTVCGQRGRDHIIQNYHIDSTIRKWDELIQEELAKPSTYRPWRLLNF